MPKVENPKIKIRIITEFGDLEFVDDDVDVQIEKDLEEEPNEAMVTLHNFESDNRAAIVDAGRESAPIEIYLTPFGQTDYAMAFRGEISDAKSERPLPDPGMHTIIQCTSQKINHRAFYLEEKTFSKGTPVAAIINWMVDQVGLPKQVGSLPADITKVAYKVSGPAFKTLKQYIFDFGLYAHILDGTLYVADFYSTQSINPYVIDQNLLTEPPEETTRTDIERIEIITVRQNKFGVKKKRKKRIKVKGPSEYRSLDTVDSTVDGIDLEMLCNPDIQPDMYISVGGEVYRVQSVSHDCDNFGGPYRTSVSADVALDTI